VKSENRLDEQFCVSTRLAVSWINAIIKAARMEDAGWALNMDSIQYEAVNEMFKDFAAFKSRRDFRDHTREWFMGEPIDSLPPLEGSPLEGASEKNHASDVGDAPNQEGQPGGIGEGQEDPVPVRQQDAAEARP
jgi:hypothetical protein